MTKTPRELARARTMTEVVRIGRAHLVTEGAAGLSLRAVARDLGVVSSAVYRYVKNRDELLTLLVVDGYNELGDAVDAAVAAAAGGFRAQFDALAHAVRAWGIAEPARYALLFGTPVPGYEAPAERTTGPGTRVIGRLARILDDAYRAGRLAGPDAPTVPVPESLRSDFAAVRDEMGLSVPDAALARGVLAWAALFGAVSFEVFGQYGTSTFGDREGLFGLHVDALAELAGLSCHCCQVK
ncbi:TetR/AcrR family transcriptional regulator [Specibacter cremeus]|uniref:TetR/AcrR family transcriptional regulator n=1 Tax=Specibacter cremeus TaxID=1629051 RepID=UPI000F795318|nr:TetR-like C-terminal domain-containing protein [Specibacter cremeus]